jgi:hypothetical protein
MHLNLRQRFFGPERLIGFDGIWSQTRINGIEEEIYDQAELSKAVVRIS